MASLLKEGEDIVISGISGRYPESDSVDEFAQNLYNKVDMITQDDRRWPTG
jgi:fatty acid synthase